MRSARLLTLLAGTMLLACGPSRPPEDPDAAPSDCAGTPGGKARRDLCNVCDEDPANDCKGCDTDLEGYISAVGDGRWRLTNATKGVPVQSGACCFESPEAVRAAYPNLKLFPVDGTELPECAPLDCADVPGGTAVRDGCNTCDADASNDCAACDADLDGYISEVGDGRYRITRATDGRPTNSGACCFGSFDEARASYPDLKLLAVASTELPTCITIDCAGVENGPAVLDPCGTCDADASNDCQACAADIEGYITRQANGSYKITFASAGRPENGEYCCPATPEAARQAYPSMKLYLVPDGGPVPSCE